MIRCRTSNLYIATYIACQMPSIETENFIERACTLFGTGRYLDRHDAAREARRQIEQEKLSREAANRNSKTSERNEHAD